MQSQRQKRNYLHPTMYLLIPYQTTTSDEQLANLHPTMYLLILFNLTQNRIQYTFTSHYVSINSEYDYIMEHKQK